MSLFPRLCAGVSFSMVLLSLMSASAAIPECHFATVDQGAVELRKADDFTTRLSAFDRSARMKTSEEVSTATFMDFVAAQVKAWTSEEEAAVKDALKPLIARFEGLNVGPLPEVWLIRTSGLEEGNAAYTRGRSIVLPDSMLGKGREALTGLLAHELFHVISRANPALRDQLYQIIGFEKCEEVLLPPALADRRITNPDAPVWAHAIRVKADGQDVQVVPVLISAVSKYPENGTDEFFQFLTLRFQPVENKPAIAMLGMSQIEGFMEQVGRNTGYIIHPEEILADNFKLLMTGAEDVPSPQILEAMKKLLASPR